MYTDFEFANKRLSDFGCVLCHINTESGLREIDIGCDITFKTVKNNKSSIHSITSSTYESVYTTTLEIIKNPCNQEIMYMTHNEIRPLVKWLNVHGYHKFKPIKYNNNPSDVHYYGSFKVKENAIGNNIIGLSLTFESNAPYGFGEENKIETTVLSKYDKLSIWGDSDEMGILYPTVKVTCLEDGNLEIINETTGNKVVIKNCSIDETIVMDGEHEVITTDNTKHTTFYNDFNYTYLDIDTSDYDGVENVYTFSIPCEVTICYSPIRKVGVL